MSDNEEKFLTDSFKKILLEYKKIDDQIREASSHMKKIKVLKDKLSNKIHNRMKNYNIDELDLNDSKIKTYVSKTRGGITKEYVYERLMLLVKDKEKVEKMIDFIYDLEARPIKTEKHAVKRMIRKAKK